MPLAFVFPGQGSQYVGMGQALAQTHPEARAVLDEADAALGGGLLQLLFEGHDDELRKAAERAAEGTDPQQDLNGSPEYRRHLAQVLTRRALEQITAHH